MSSRAATTSSEARGALVGEWRTLLDRHAKVSCALEKSLQAEHHIGLSEFEILDRLAEIDDDDEGMCRMTDLTGEIYLSQSALSRAVARLEADGLVERRTCSNDRRALFVALTDDGRALLAAARPTHREVLDRTWTACED